MKQLVDKRQHLRYKSRNIKDNEKLSEIKSEIADMTKQIGEFRKEVKLCDGIIKRSNIMKDKIESVRQEKEERMNEHIRRKPLIRLCVCRLKRVEAALKITRGRCKTYCSGSICYF